MWRSLLPSWFIAQCAEEKSKEESAQWMDWWRRLPREEQTRAEREKKWSLNSWLYWFQPDERQWFWWDAAVEDPDTVRVIVEVEGLPFPWGALDWLFRASGATGIQEE